MNIIIVMAPRCGLHSTLPANKLGVGNSRFHLGWEFSCSQIDAGNVLKFL